MVSQTKTRVKPFLKWAGGKTQLLPEIERLIPFHKTDSFVFVEPFIGSGSVLFYILNNYPNLSKVIINDLNTDLINCYKAIKQNVQPLIDILESMEHNYHAFEQNSEQRKTFYYTQRNLFNTRSLDELTQAALFIFLKRTCFNGLYRVNSKNQFNVPQGSYKNPKICHADNLTEVSKALQNVEILNGDYRETIGYACQNSFFYFDPPYKPLSNTSSFNAYAKDIFDDESQIQLKIFCDDITQMGSQWVLSNSDVKGINPNDDFFDDLYKDYNIARVFAKRTINSNANKRGKLTELLISNML